MARAPEKLRGSLRPVVGTPELLLSLRQGHAKPGKLSPTPALLRVCHVSFFLYGWTSASIFGGGSLTSMPQTLCQMSPTLAQWLGDHFQHRVFPAARLFWPNGTSAEVHEP